MFAYHGYPHHYFNATAEGMAEVFARFEKLRSGMAPHQMPALALENFIVTYLQQTQAHDHVHGHKIVEALEKLLRMNLLQYDIHFTEDAALHLAAGTFFAGRKVATPGASLLPEALLELWEHDRVLQQRFPEPHDLTRPENLLHWALRGGRDHPVVKDWQTALVPWTKHPDAPWDRSALRSLQMLPTNTGVAGLGSLSDPIEQKVAAATKKFGPNHHPSDTNQLQRHAARLLRGLARRIEQR